MDKRNWREGKKKLVARGDLNFIGAIHKMRKSRRNAYFFILCLLGFTLEASEKQVALLFLTRADLNHCALWKEWIESEPGKFSVYSHAKNQVTDRWFAQFRIAETLPTSWESTMLAQQALLRAALQNRKNIKFIFLSEGCVPVKSAKETYDLLTKDDLSYMQFGAIWWEGCSWRTLSEFPAEHHRGNSQWAIFNRRHAQLIADDHYWIFLASNHGIDNESYPSTFLQMMGVLNEVYNESKTYVDWRWPRDHPASPYLFRKKDVDSVKELSRLWHSSLFARKFDPDFPDDVLRALWGQKSRD